MADSQWSPAQKMQIVLQGLRGASVEERQRNYGLSEEEYQSWVAAFIAGGEKGLSRDTTDSGTTDQLFQLLINSIPHAVFCKNAEGIFTFGNTAFCQLAKIDFDDLIGKTDYDLHPPEAADKYRADDMRVMTEDEIFHTQETNELMDGTVRWAEVFKVPLKNTHGDVVGIMGMYWDITDQKEIEGSLRSAQENLEFMVGKRTAELLEANKRLEEGSQLKMQFMSSVSHELRTPLTSVLGFAKLISKDAGHLQSAFVSLDHPGMATLSRIIRNANIISEEGDRLKRLIDDLLDLSKIDSGKMAWNDQRIDVIRIAKEAVQTMQGQFAARPLLELMLDAPSEPAPVLADPDRIKQIFINLLSNAAKFTEAGQVRVTVTTHSPDWVQVSVKDTGQGISQEDIARIFEDYYQGIQAMISEKGTGLGLSICHQIITHYHGKFWAESSPGKGATFHFRLPLLKK